MTTQQPQSVMPVYFNDGCVAHADYVYIAAKPKLATAEAYDAARMFFYNGKRWYSHDLDWNVVSVTFAPEHDAFFALSLYGQVSRVDDGDAVETIPVDRALGGLSQIKWIDRKAYACGLQGQVFRRDAAQSWVHIDAGIFDPKRSAKALNLTSIDGTSERDLYVVGFKGRMLHFDGKRWSDLPSPTHANLQRVHCTPHGETYVCGNRGSFFRVTQSHVEDFSLDIEEDFWGLTSFQGKIYVAALDGLYVFDGASLSELDTGLEEPIGGYRLDARDRQLWSFGVDDLAYFDGRSWTRVEHPDNK